MSQDTPFSFHCMICFEEFHPTERYPVVLPCGHTYVCSACAARLDRCMECRTPLYTSVRPPSLTNHAATTTSVATTPVRSSWSSARYGGRVSSTPASASSSGESSPPAQRPIKKRHPLPKNVVLLSLIEATELATQDVQKKYSSGLSPRLENERNNFRPDAGPYDLYSMNSMVDNLEDEEEEKIKVGTSLAVGVAGTYAVAAREGMEIFSSRPATSTSLDDSRNTEDVDNLVQSKNSPDSKKRARLSFGDRVQIVSVEDGWAKLARGYGYVLADKNHLVKVGNSVDQACKLEAMLRTLSNRRRELRLEQSKVDNQFIRLMNELQLSLQKDEDLTVIVADAFADVPGIPDELEAEKKEDSPAPTPTHAAAAEQHDVEDLKQQARQAVANHSIQRQPRASFMCFATNVFGDSGEDGADGAAAPTERNVTPTPPEPPAMFSSVSNPSPRAMRAGAQAWRARHGRPQASEEIDFRTGMSGHMALLSTHAHPHEYLEPTYSSHSSYPLKMSSHTGLTMSKSRTAPSSILPSLTLPNFGRSRDSEDNIQPSGSM